jgi:plastocyanin
MTFKDSIAAKRYALVAAVCFGLFAAGCGSSTSPSSSQTSPVSPTNPEGTNPPNLLTITITKGVYSPNPLTVKVGQSVNWLNSDTFAHTATDPGVFDTGSIAPTSAADVPVLFTAVGTYSFHCTLHANETGTIIVTQ